MWSSSQRAEAVARFLRQLLEHIVVPSVEVRRAAAPSYAYTYTYTYTYA